MTEFEFTAIATAGQEYGRALERADQAQTARNKLVALAQGGAFVIGMYDAEKLCDLRQKVLKDCKATLLDLHKELVK